jgi:MFS family permease
MAQSAWAPFVPYAKTRVQANNQPFGLLLLCFGAGSILSMPTMGALASRYGCKRLIQIAADAIFLGLAAVSMAPLSTTLALSLFQLGTSIGAIDVVIEELKMKNDRFIWRVSVISIDHLEKVTGAFTAFGSLPTSVVLPSLRTSRTIDELP